MTNYCSLIGVEDLKQGLGNASFRVVDCRFDLMQAAKGRLDYDEGHIPGARYANLDEDLAGPVTESTGRHPLPPPEAFAETLGSWGIANNSQVVVYDHGSGAIAARLWWMLKWVGHEHVAVLDGGFAAWQEAGYAVTDQAELTNSAEFLPLPESDLVISTNELKELVESGNAPTLVDARDSVRFTGGREPIDSVAGHIPGAINYPFSEGLTTGNRWKSPQELRAGWARILGRHNKGPWVSMCGSGVTACHLALSAGLAGYPLPRLYVGSWSEWIRDPERPIATDSD